MAERFLRPAKAIMDCMTERILQLYSRIPFFPIAALNSYVVYFILREENLDYYHIIGSNWCLGRLTDRGKRGENIIFLERMVMQYLCTILVNLIHGQHGHTSLMISLLIIGTCLLIWASGALGPESTASNDVVTSVKRGVWSMIAVFLAYSLLQAPSMVLIRPHPAIWRLVHGMAVVYLVVLTFFFAFPGP